jgi:hypothetical protein
VGRPREDCFSEITGLLESLGAVRLRLIEGPGKYRSATWRLQGSSICTVLRDHNGWVTVQTDKRAPVLGQRFLKMTQIAIARQRVARLPD